MRTITTSGGVRNCQTDTPAARATTNSILRDKLRNAIIDPNRTANGKRLFGDRRRSQERQARHENPGRALRIARTTQELHQIDGVDKDEDHHESGDHRRAQNGRRDRMTASGRSRRNPRERPRRAPRSAAGRSAPRRRGKWQAESSRRRWRRTERRRRASWPRIPSMRTPANARIAPAIASPRPWRVVRASPSAAKAMRPPAKA